MYKHHHDSSRVPQRPQVPEASWLEQPRANASQHSTNKHESAFNPCVQSSMLNTGGSNGSKGKVMRLSADNLQVKELKFAESGLVDGQV